MLLKQTSMLPLNDNFSVQVQIRIFSNGSEYIADVSTNLDKWYRFRIGLKQHDIEELNSELQLAVEKVSNEIETSGTCDESLSLLAQKGSYAFKRIFAEGIPRDIISKALKTGVTIQFTSEDFFIPWELLYDGPVGGQVDISRFWGIQHIVSRALIQEAQPGDEESPTIQTICPQVGLIACHELEHVFKKEIPALQELHRQNRIILLPLRRLNALQRNEELVYLGHFLQDEQLQIVHLACHAQEKKPRNQSYLLVSDEFAVSIEDFFVRDFKIKHHPFVILNACLTGTISPLYTSNWAALFWERGARGVLATEFHVPDSFAAAFTEELYNHFLSGKPIGEALLDTRRYFWEQQSNPLGLAYALYSSPSIRIAK
jgi:CHAT domain-containing protein